MWTEISSPFGEQLARLVIVTRHLLDRRAVHRADSRGEACDVSLHQDIVPECADSSAGGWREHAWNSTGAKLSSHNKEEEKETRFFGVVRLFVAATQRR